MTNATSERTLYVGLYLPAQSEPTTAAIMKLKRVGNAEAGHFAYGLGYLEKPEAISLNPDHLPLQKAVFQLASRLIREGGAMPLTIKDALPDAWGRLVIAHQLGGRIASDDELLLLTNDDRVGAMVFSETTRMPECVPSPRFDLKQLADAVKRLQYDLTVPEPLKRLLHQGASLGGARPKASFVHDNALWLAKFPANDDPVDVQTLEAATQGLAMQCGIRVPRSMTVAIGKGEHAFLSQRFDRIQPVDNPRRLHYLSASALLNIPYESSAGSYTEFARVLRRLSIVPGEDLKELFRRMVFNILVDNSDDHLKNHGMLYMGNGRFRLSPAFDIVPQLTNLGYQMLSIDGISQEASLDRAIQSAAHFGLSIDDAQRVVSELAETVYKQWATYFKVARVSTPLMNRVKSCFERQARIVGAPVR
ncbi:MAG: type II toxin-antitoxin system HipA family toxin [Hydrogenophilales bacterium]|nr:type II toxin-antitoxin system HipA family toxin [Hydrogenophilales bacterium]